MWLILHLLLQFLTGYKYINEYIILNTNIYNFTAKFRIIVRFVNLKLTIIYIILYRTSWQLRSASLLRPNIFAKYIRRNRLALHSCAAVLRALESSGCAITRTKQWRRVGRPTGSCGVQFRSALVAEHGCHRARWQPTRSRSGRLLQQRGVSSGCSSMGLNIVAAIRQQPCGDAPRS